MESVNSIAASDDSWEPEILDTGNMRIAYRKIEGKKSPGVVFLSGFLSSMKRRKPLAVEAFCREKDLPFLRFDYFGIGESPGKLNEVTLGMWIENVFAVIERLTRGLQVLVGSSMGAIFCLLAAAAQHDRIKGVICIAPALNMPNRMNLLRNHPTKSGFVLLPEEYGKLDLKNEFVDDSHLINLYERTKDKKLDVICPVRFLHGMKDFDVPYQLSIDAMSMLKTNDVVLSLVTDADHAFDDPLSLQTIREILENLINY
ncbi:TAGLN3 (predicted) [Pycnogonum litorale]